jgi:hypothetical protein
MADRTLKLIMARSKQGQSLSQISQLTERTIDEVKEQLGQATGLTPKEVSIIFRMKEGGLGLEQISQEFKVELEVLKLFLPIEQNQIDALADQDKGPYEISLGVSEAAYTPDCKPYSRSPPATTEETKQYPKPQPTKTLPKPQHTAFYFCERNTNKLHRVNLLTGEKSWHLVPSYQFKSGCRWSELPGGSLLITGGEVREVEKVDTLREYAVSALPPMHTARRDHAAVYHSQHVYVLAGFNGRFCMRECERYACAESRWEALPALPVAGWHMSAVEIKNSLYALGGSRGLGKRLDTVQKLNLHSLTWKLMQLKLPQAIDCFPCFKTETQVYLVNSNALCSFTPLQVKVVGTLDRSIYECYLSYNSRGTLYYEYGEGICSLAIRI